MHDTTTLADPTDFGNEPGDGPLRRGGQEPSEDIAGRHARDLPSTLSKAAKRQRKALELVRALYAGQDEVHDKGVALLPDNPGEDPKNYHDRLVRSVFHNFFRRTVDGMVGLIFRQDPVLGDDVPPLIREHWENIDLAGTHGDVFLRELETDAVTVGHAAILVDFPRTEGVQTAADEMTGAVRPYWVPILKDNILSWRTTNRAGQTILKQVVLLEKQMVEDGEFGEKEQTRYRHLYVDPDDTEAPVHYRLLEVTEDRRVIETDTGRYLNQDEIPISEIPTSGRRGVFDSDPPLIDVAHLNVAHYQQWSDYALALHKTVPFLFTAGLNMTDPMTGQPLTELVVGPNSGLNMTDPNGKAEYVGHAGTNIKDQRQALEDLKSDIGSLGLAMLAPQKRAAETAEAKRLDKSTSDSALSVSARALQDGVERALGYHARYLGLDSGGSVEINRDFEGLIMQADVMRAYAELVKVGFPKWMALSMLQQGGRLPEDADLATLELEWEVGEGLSDMQPEQPDEGEREAA